MAGRFSVEAVFKAVDRVTAPVSKMQNKVGKFTRSMERGLRRVDRGMGRLASGMRQGATVALGGLVAVGGTVAASLKTMADKADALAKQSRLIQFPIEDLQEWKFVAEQSGVSTETFDKSLGAFSKRLGEARAGTGALRSMLRKSNPALLEQLKSTDNISEALEIYLDAIRKTTNASDRSAMASAAFSRAGMKMTSITDNSADAIRALRKEQRENGVITEKQANQAEAWNDAVNSLKLSLIGFKDAAVAPLLKDFTKYARAMREIIVQNKAMVSSKVRDFFKFIADNFQDIVKWAKRIGAGIAVFFVLLGVLKTLIVVMTAVNLVMSLNPIGLIVIAIASLIAAVAAAMIWWDEFKAKFLSLSTPVKIVIGILGGPLLWLIAVAGMIKENWGPVSAFFSDLWGRIGAVFSAGIDHVKELIEIGKGFAALFMEAWEPISVFFSDLWSQIAVIFGSAFEKIAGIVQSIKGVVSGVTGTLSSIGGFFGFGNDSEDEQTDRSRDTAPQMVSPQERIARSIEEKQTTTTSEVTIRDETGRAEITRGKMGPGLTLAATGGF